MLDKCNSETLYFCPFQTLDVSHVKITQTWVSLTLNEAMRTIRLITMCQSTTQSERSYCSSEMNLRCEAVNVHVILLWGSTVSSGDITQTLARAVIAFLSFKKSFRHEASTFRCCYKSKTKCMSEMGFSDTS